MAALELMAADVKKDGVLHEVPRLKQCDAIPYEDIDGSPLLASVSGLGGRQGTSGGEDTVVCPYPECKQEWPVTLASLHAAFHILTNRGHPFGLPVQNLNLPTGLCGFCGFHKHAQHGLDQDDLRCISYLTDVNGNFAPRAKHAVMHQNTRCVTAGVTDSFVSSMKKSTRDNPCTNHLIRCPDCPVLPVPNFQWMYLLQGVYV